MEGELKEIMFLLSDVEESGCICIYFGKMM